MFSYNTHNFYFLLCYPFYNVKKTKKQTITQQHNQELLGEDYTSSKIDLYNSCSLSMNSFIVIGWEPIWVMDKKHGFYLESGLL